jgi:3D (Asp-Asp-Asp) domain-containing protein
MPAPAAAIAAKAAARLAVSEVLRRVRQQPGAPPPAPKDGRGTLKLLIAAAVAVLLVPALIVVVLFAGAQQAAGCDAGAPLPGTWTGPGSLGGVAGTGVTRAELTAARGIPRLGGTRIAAGEYSPTAYFPHPDTPSTNCAATCLVTACGIRVNNARRRAYLIASNPHLNQYGALAYIWPNPYGWTGPFVVADTGSAFGGIGRLDFYIFQDTGETWQQALARAYQWSPANRVRVSARPIQAGGPNIATAAPGPADASAPPAAGCAVILDAELGEHIARIAARHVGAGPSIPGFQPPSTRLAWCAWFLSNVWRQAGVAIELTFFSGAPYTWGEQQHTLWKTIGQPPPGPTPPLGSALMYGSGPQNTSASQHVNLVSKVNADGSFMTIGGNESNRVMLSGPCRLTGGAATHLRGPGCDSRPIYGITTPGARA